MESEQNRLITFTVPLVPPSVNTYTRHAKGNHYKTRETLAFETQIYLAARGKKVFGKFFAVELNIYLGPKQGRDIDNLPKCVLDGLANAGVFRGWDDYPLSDNYVDEMVVRKFRHDRQNPRTEITVRAI